MEEPNIQPIQESNKEQEQESSLKLSDIIPFKPNENIVKMILDNQNDFPKSHFRLKTENQIYKRIGQLNELIKKDENKRWKKKRLNESKILLGKRFIKKSQGHLHLGLAAITVMSIDCKEFDFYQGKKKEDIPPDVLKERENDFAEVTAFYYEIGQNILKRM